MPMQLFWLLTTDISDMGNNEQIFIRHVYQDNIEKNGANLNKTIREIKKKINVTSWTLYS